MKNVEIVFCAAFGDEMRIVRIKNVSGAGNLFHILIDDYYNGALNLNGEVWRWLNMPSDFTSSDRDLLISRFQTKLDK
ncbi:hypothetical protein [Pedobacter sp. Leaf170]|uniref:hypothetical protein n=1 Tax=Pedobacter sp. Leaf170 TaxID=2876558 RepID=UPI001E49D40E|nr:hypothetical protein [Pedobacter sp. Leaf170]